MNILHLSDIHGNKQIMKESLKAQNKADIVFISGDLIENQNDISLIKKWIKNFEIPVVISSGNHDVEVNNGEWLYELESKNVFVHKKIEFQGFIIGSKPYLSENFDYDVDILIYHIPPKGSFTAIDRKFNDFGDYFLKELLLNEFNPKYLFCGHVHNPMRLKDKINKTVIINSCYKRLNFSISVI